MIVRILFIVIGLSLVGAGYYLGRAGVWSESYDLDRSVRTGSPGVVGGLGRVK